MQSSSVCQVTRMQLFVSSLNLSTDYEIQSFLCETQLLSGVGEQTKLTTNHKYFAHLIHLQLYLQDCLFYLGVSGQVGLTVCKQTHCV